MNYIDNSDWVKIQKIIKKRKFTGYKLLAQSNRIYLFSGQEIWTINGCFHHDIANIEREQVLERNKKEQALLLSNREFSWKYPVDCGRFEMLCADLLEKMHTTSKIRLVGSVNNADEGRDILIYNVDGSLYLCQCKAYQKNIGKSNVRDIRDTIEYHGASGFFLMASSGITSQLINHLELLKTKYKVDWYSEREIFKLLRQYPSIADAYRDIIEIKESM